MEKTKNFLLKSLFAVFIVFTIGLVITQIAFAADATPKSVGTVTFVTGDASIVRADKTVVKAVKNDALNAGDTIDTKTGRLQLSLIDGGKVSLQPNTIYKINKYEFTGKEDGSEYALTELVKGGLRTISGAIGHKNRDRYQLKTTVATIGIRGTEFTVNFNDNQLLMTTNHGSVDVCNAGGCLNALSGQSIGVGGLGLAPKMSEFAAKAAAAAPNKVKPAPVADKEKDSAAVASEETKVSTNVETTGNIKETSLQANDNNQSTAVTNDDVKTKPLPASIANEESFGIDTMVNNKDKTQMGAPILNTNSPELDMQNKIGEMDVSNMTDNIGIGSMDTVMQKMNEKMMEKMMENQMDNLINQSNGNNGYQVNNDN